jgi:HEAT repeat protein
LDTSEGIEGCTAQGLEATGRDEDWALFEGYVNVAFRRPDPRQSAPLCSALARRTFEVNNEDIVEALGEIKDPRSVECLTATLKWEPDWDEFRALAVKCVWALAAIGTDEAWAALDAAATEGPDVIREEVDYERGRRSSRGPAPM